MRVAPSQGLPNPGGVEGNTVGGDMLRHHRPRAESPPAEEAPVNADIALAVAETPPAVASQSASPVASEHSEVVARALELVSQVGYQ